MEVVEGQILAGKYRIERVLGRGGMGVVVAATHLQLGERVALKFLLPGALENAEAVARFDREARAAVRIKSEHVARVSDVGNLDNGAPYLVMEYLEGIDLSTWLVQRGPLPIEQAVGFVLQACEAIAEAHTLGIVHRDLKPANLFVIERPDGLLAVKVLDFGISKSTGLGASGAGITRTSAAIGSPLYMSPEQMQSARDVDTRGDIWALGVLLYELVSGRTPFPGESMAELVLKVVTAAPFPLRGVCVDAPPGLEAVVLKCLEKDRRARYQTVADLAVALLEFAPRHSKPSVERIGRVMQRAGMSTSGTQLPPSSNPVDAHSIPAPQTLASWGQTKPPAKRRHRVVLIATVSVAVPISALAGIALLSSSWSGAGALSSAAPLGRSPLAPTSAEAVHGGKSTLGVESTVVAGSASASPLAVPVLSASSALSQAPTSTPPAPSARPSRPPHGGALHVSRPAPVPSSVAVPPPVSTPTAAASKAGPAPPVKNPLKMSIQ